MSDEFDVYFSGECLPDFEPGHVAAGIARTFSLSDQAAAQLMSGGRHRIKAGCDQATAMRYEKAMAAIGARVSVEPRGQPLAESQKVTEVPQKDAPSMTVQPTARATFDAGISRIDRDPGTNTEVDGDNGIPWEAPSELQSGDNTAFSIAPVGAVLAEGVTTTPPVEVTIPEYDVSEAGEMIPNLPDQREQVKPNVDHLQIAPLENE